MIRVENLFYILNLLSWYLFYREEK